MSMSYLPKVKKDFLSDVIRNYVQVPSSKLAVFMMGCLNIASLFMRTVWKILGRSKHC